MLKEFTKSVLLLEAVSKIRDERTEAASFRFYLERIGRYLSYELSKELEYDEITISTPIEKTRGFKQRDNVTILSILRAALPMTNAVLNEFNNGTLGIVSASRGEMIGAEGKNFQIESHYSKIPSINDRIVIIVDPMLATGSTVKYLLKSISESNEVPKRIFVICAIASKYGIEQIEQEFPLVHIYAAAVDEVLNSKGYIVPGLGDAGDRAFNTGHL